MEWAAEAKLALNAGGDGVGGEEYRVDPWAATGPLSDQMRKDLHKDGTKIDYVHDGHTKM